LGIRTRQRSRYSASMSFGPPSPHSSNSHTLISTTRTRRQTGK
jgi:hypothetical protein